MQPRKKIQFKQHLSIAKIGKIRFWIGILLGVFSAFLFFGFIFFILEIADILRVIQRYDLPVKSDVQIHFEKIFLLALSVAFGNNTMLRYWFARPSKYLKKTYKYTSARIVNYSLFIEYVVLFGAISFITRILMYAPFIDLNLFNEYGYVLYLFPVYLFFIAWTEVSRYIKTQRWMLYTFSISIVFVILGSLINTSSYKIGEVVFRKMHEEDIYYLENELKIAKQEYNIDFSAETISALKELRTKRTLLLIEKTRLAFKTEGKVSLDTIILEKIVLHNMKGYYTRKYGDSPYTYAFPFQVYEQLKKVDPNSPEAKELIELLETFHEIGMYLYNNDTEIQTRNAGKRDLLYNNDMRGINLNYDRMYNQTSFLVYHLQKSGLYNHPFFTSSVPFPPPYPMDISIMQEKFPEFITNQEK